MAFCWRECASAPSGPGTGSEMLGRWVVCCAVGMEEDTSLFLKEAPRNSCRRQTICPAKLGSCGSDPSSVGCSCGKHPAAPGGKLVPPQGAVASETLASQGTNGRGDGNSTREAVLCRRAAPPGAQTQLLGEKPLNCPAENCWGDREPSSTCPRHPDLLPALRPPHLPSTTVDVCFSSELLQPPTEVSPTQIPSYRLPGEKYESGHIALLLLLFFFFFPILS